MNNFPSLIPLFTTFASTDDDSDARLNAYKMPDTMRMSIKQMVTTLHGEISDSTIDRGLNRI